MECDHASEEARNGAPNTAGEHATDTAKESARALRLAAVRFQMKPAEVQVTELAEEQERLREEVARATQM